MVFSSNLGFPRIGDMRQLKKAVEAYWKGQSSQKELLEKGAELRAHNWKLQKDAGIDIIPSNDFSFYDQVLDTTCLLGMIPKRYKHTGGNVDIDTYFAMARGAQKDGLDVTAMEMTKWFDTNYHYMVPEFEDGMKAKLSSTKIFDQFAEAKALGISTRPVLIGPVTYLTIGKRQNENMDWMPLWESIMPVYEEILKKLEEMGATGIQIDEPCLATDLWEGAEMTYKKTYERLRKATGMKIMLATYFDSLRDNAKWAYDLDVDGIHIDLCRGSGQANTTVNKAENLLDEALSKIGSKTLSLGIVDGRNIWKNDLSASLSKIEKAVAKLGSDKVFVAGSSSLQHAPVDLKSEEKLDAELKGWMAYATQKLDEIATLTKGANKGRDAIAEELKVSDAAQASRKASPRIHNKDVEARVKAITPDMKKRKSPFAQRQKVQHAALKLPLYPTTTIGSFPQTPDIRKARADFKAGKIKEADYKSAMEKEIKMVVDFQHEVDLDVLVHGEPERNDMVEYFGEQLSGFAFSQYGWVQSYGSRCVKPPIIFGDVSRPKPMTVEWSKYAQSITPKIMKGMLTGPITILQWSFVRDDQPRNDTALQIALAIRDEVSDLEKAGIKMIQIDEAAFREGLPLRKADWKDYLDNAVENFRISQCCVEDTTQIHTHMCYSEFNDVIDSIGDMDADVISIECSRSQMELLEAFIEYKYPNEIGPGVYDIHSPRVPSTQEMVDLLDKAKKNLDERQIWVNPDCGLKTRAWPETKAALKGMVDAAKQMRAKSKASAAA
jgi:5-methyltetrahydropteroyltriglutamate--homocysteine methyltransferase